MKNKIMKNVIIIGFWTFCLSSVAAIGIVMTNDMNAIWGGWAPEWLRLTSLLYVGTFGYTIALVFLLLYPFKKKLEKKNE